MQSQLQLEDFAKRVLDSRGVPPTPENFNAIKQALVANPQLFQEILQQAQFERSAIDPQNLIAAQSDPFTKALESAMNDGSVNGAGGAVGQGVSADGPVNAQANAAAQAGITGIVPPDIPVATQPLGDATNAQVDGPQFPPNIQPQVNFPAPPGQKPVNAITANADAAAQNNDAVTGGPDFVGPDLLPLAAILGATGVAAAANRFKRGAQSAETKAPVQPKEQVVGKQKPDVTTKGKTKLKRKTRTRTSIVADVGNTIDNADKSAVLPPSAKETSNATTKTPGVQTPPSVTTEATGKAADSITKRPDGQFSLKFGDRTVVAKKVVLDGVTFFVSGTTIFDEAGKQPTPSRLTRLKSGKPRGATDPSQTLSGEIRALVRALRK